jgi:hypothetical protein
VNGWSIAKELSPEIMWQVERYIYNILRSFGPLESPLELHPDWGRTEILQEVFLRFGGDAADAATQLPILTRH